MTVTVPAKLMSDVSSPQVMPEHVRSITLIRHGRTSYNARHCFQGQIDIPLDEIGEWQVRQTAQALRSLYVESHPERRQLVVASDLSRAMATAHAFADPLGLVVHPDARVRERNFGEWEGKERYGDFKQVVAGAVYDFLVDFQARYAAISDDELLSALKRSEDAVRPIAEATLLRAQQAVGLRPRV